MREEWSGIRGVERAALLKNKKDICLSKLVCDCRSDLVAKKFRYNVSRLPQNLFLK